VADNFSPGSMLAWLAHEARAALRRDVSAAAASAFSGASFGEFADLWLNPTAYGDNAQIKDLRRLRPASQEALAAGFEYVGRRPGAARG
jgi:hypothetical protein